MNIKEFGNYRTVTLLSVILKVSCAEAKKYGYTLQVSEFKIPNPKLENF